MATLEERPTDGTDTSRSPAAASELDLVLVGSMTRAGIRSLCERAREVVEEREPKVLVLDLGSIGDPDAVTVDALARLQLTVRPLGTRIRFRGACGEIRQLVVLMGLADILTFDSGSSVEPGWEVEEGEQVRGVEEERDPRDTSA